MNDDNFRMIMEDNLLGLTYLPILSCLLITMMNILIPTVRIMLQLIPTTTTTTSFINSNNNSNMSSTTKGRRKLSSSSWWYNVTYKLLKFFKFMMGAPLVCALLMMIYSFVFIWIIVLHRQQKEPAAMNEFDRSDGMNMTTTTATTSEMDRITWDDVEVYKVITSDPKSLVWSLSLIIFGISYITLLYLQYIQFGKLHNLLQLRHQHEQQQQYQDHNKGGGLEKDWFHWTTRQFITWIYMKYCHRHLPNIGSSVYYTSNRNRYKTTIGGNNQQQQEEEEEEEEKKDNLISIIYILYTQRINGMILPSLTVDTLQSMGLSYGDAMFIMVDISELMDRYPATTLEQNTMLYQQQRQQQYRSSGDDIEMGHCHIRGSRNGSSVSVNYQTQNNGIDLDEWLGKEKEKKKSNVIEEEEQKGSTVTPQQDEFEAMQYTIQDQLGIQLATFKANNNDEGTEKHNEQDIEGRNYDEEEMTNMGSIMSNSNPTPNDVVGLQTDEELFNTMPPHIREIAQKHPSIVQTLLNRQRQNRYTPKHKRSDSLTRDCKSVRFAADTKPGVALDEGKTIIDSNHTEGNDGISIDPEILNKMPPHLREIAMRRPDLLQTAMSKSGSGSSSNHNSSLGHDPSQEDSTQIMMQTIPEEIPSQTFARSTKLSPLYLNDDVEEESDGLLEDGNDTHFDYNDEMVGLLRKRRGR